MNFPTWRPTQYIPRNVRACLPKYATPHPRIHLTKDSLSLPRLRARRPKEPCSDSRKRQQAFLLSNPSTNRCWCPPSLLLNVHRRSFPRGHNDWGAKQATHFHMVVGLRLRISGAVPLLPYKYACLYDVVLYLLCSGIRPEWFCNMCCVSVYEIE
jgi:hypothetical protein